MEERELIQRCINNERSYQKALYEKYADKMYNVCLTYAENEDEAADILQDGFIKVFRSLSKFSFSGSFEGWIRRIIVNTALEYYRKNASEMENLINYNTSIDTIEDEIIEKISAKEIIRLVNGLPSKAATILKLYAIEGLRHKEIAGLLGISVGTSKSQLNRARMLLKKSFIQINEG